MHWDTPGAIYDDFRGGRGGFAPGREGVPSGRFWSGLAAVSGPTLPPPPGGPPPGGQPPVGPPWPGPPGSGPYPQQPYPVPPQWVQPGPPPRGTPRWLLALAFLAVIAVSVAATVWFTHRGSGNQAAGGISSSVATGEVASAGDTGPVGIITEDPTCDRWQTLEHDVASKLAEWNKRDPAVPGSAWTPQQRQMFESAARVLHAQADQSVPLAKETPHRVMRELYEQQIAYSRAYADALSNYMPADEGLALTTNGLAAALTSICAAITNLSAADRAPSVPPIAPPSVIAPTANPSDPARFLTSSSDACAKIQALTDRQAQELELWYRTDPDIPASQRSSADKILWDMAAKVLRLGADKTEKIGRSYSGNAVMEDFLLVAAQYFRAFSNAVPTSTAADAKLYDAAQKAQVSVLMACKALRG